ncbi:MAG: galactokinase [Chloroflexota bacterium]|nr:galactokinase [Chloroflexota bacterium]
MSAARAARVDALAAAFRREFGRPPEGVSEAPGRVNLIGEHVDYNDGLVLPFAIDRSVLCAWALRDDTTVRAYSAEFSECSTFDLHDISHAAPGAWENYIRGVVAALRAAGHAFGGVDLALTGDVPPGAGLSSSAAVEVAVAGALRDAFGLPLSGPDLALLCQRAENAFVGVQSGIMDQFASALSHRDAALLVDCRTLAHRDVPLRLAGAGLAVVITDSGVRRELLSSAYNDRRRECAEAVARLRDALRRPQLASLRDVSLDEVASRTGRRALADDSNDTPLRRARHVVSEIARVAAAAEALDRDDFAALGRLMVESHLSLRDDYAVSTPELDLLVALATAQPYVAGSRLTGAGFGGCTVSVLQADAAASFARDVVAPYEARTGHQAATYLTSPQDGLRTWRLP